MFQHYVFIRSNIRLYKDEFFFLNLFFLNIVSIRCVSKYIYGNIDSDVQHFLISNPSVLLQLQHLLKPFWGCAYVFSFG